MVPARTLLFCFVILFVLASFPFINSVEASSELWGQKYGGGAIDSAEDIVQTSDGGYAIAGFTGSFGAELFDFWLIKTDASGNMIWNQRYGGEGIDAAYSLVETSDGGFALAGTTNSFGAGIYDFWLVKTDETGNMVWNQTYGGAENDRANELVETSDGGYALAGRTKSFGAGEYDDLWLVKTDEYGIPEFPSWTPLLIMLVAVMVAVAIYKRRLRPQTN